MNDGRTDNSLEYIYMDVYLWHYLQDINTVIRHVEVHTLYECFRRDTWLKVCRQLYAFLFSLASSSLEADISTREGSTLGTPNYFLGKD